MTMTSEQKAEASPNRPEREPVPMASTGPAAAYIEPPDAPDDQWDEEEGYGHGV
jgi:hypothetical protein